MRKSYGCQVYRGIQIVKLKACYSFYDAQGNMILSRTLENTKKKIDEMIEQAG